MRLADLYFADDDLISEGGERWVYRSAEYPDFVFKRQKPVAQRQLKKNLKGNSLRLFPSLRNRIVQKEYRAYVDCCLAPVDDLTAIPVSHLYGFAQSNIGMVQIAEKVSLDGVSLGPTLATIHANGDLDENRLGLLNAFADALLRWQIPTNDISAQNIILGKRAGREVFLAVDGFGDIHMVPVRTYSKWMRRRYLGKRLSKVAGGLSLRFDTATFVFHRVE